jgi:hypothetical protein
MQTAHLVCTLVGQDTLGTTSMVHAPRKEGLSDVTSKETDMDLCCDCFIA